MKHARLGRLAVIGAAVALSVPAVAQANEVTNWNRIATSTLVQFPGPGGGAPPALQINLAMTQGAVYDAVNAIQRRHRPLVLNKTFPSTASLEAAVANAAYRVLSSLVQDPRAGIADPLKATLLQTLATERANSLAAIPNGAAKTQGMAAGGSAAEAMLADRANDGRFGPSPWVPNTAPGHWRPLIDPVTFLPMLDPTPWVANVDPFLLMSTSQFRTKGPLPLSSAQWAIEYNEVKALGAVNSTVRTPLQTQIALFWQSGGGPALLWNPVARQLTDNPAHALNNVDSAFRFAFMNLTGADAAINCWNDKYYWDFWRPWNAIRAGQTDGNRRTEPDPLWSALLTAPYPEHPSGHLCLDGAMVTSLQMFFGNENEFDVRSTRAATLPLLPDPRHFTRFSAPLEEIVEARIWAGLHYRTADVQGLNLGREVARWGQTQYFQPLG
jgi:hypothetical protein